MKELIVAASLALYGMPVSESFVPDGYTQYDKVAMLLSTTTGLFVYYIDVALPAKDGKPVVCRFMDEKNLECLMADAEGRVTPRPYTAQSPVKS